MRQLAAYSLVLCACGGPAARSLVSATEGARRGDDRLRGRRTKRAGCGHARVATERALAVRMPDVPGGQSLEPRHLGRAGGPALGRLPGVHGRRLAPASPRLRWAVRPTLRSGSGRAAAGADVVPVLLAERAWPVS